MKELTSSQVRQMYLDFFKSKGHSVEPSASLVPVNDPTLLWINSGVATLKKYFDGSVVPENPRITNAQKSIRTNDIENVGKTARHHTMFEMLGNFSIGDYFKNEAIHWAWEFLTGAEWLAFDPEKLYVTVYPKDTEAKRIWRDEVGLSEDHIIDVEDNFWDIGAGPSGPDTEIFYDRGEEFLDIPEDDPCISSSIPPHLLRGTSGQKQLEVSDVLFDAGFSSKEEAESFGVRPGDSIVPQTETIKTANGKNIISKSWDNRYGCTLVLDALETLQNEELGHTLIAGANVQEEVGLRGSKPSVHKFNPDIFFAVDCSAADDIHTKKGTYGHLGEGTLLRIFDPGLITLPRLREYLLDTAATHNIPYQYFVSKGGTDAGAAHTTNNGVPSTVIGVCGRYIHTHQTMFSIADYEAAREMLLQALRGLDKSTVNTIVYGK